MKFKSEKQRKAVMAQYHPEQKPKRAKKSIPAKEPDKLIKKYKLLAKQTEEARRELLKKREEERKNISAFDAALKEQHRIRHDAEIRIKTLERIGFIHAGKSDVTEKSIYHIQRSEQLKGNETRFIHMGKGKYRVFYRPYYSVPVPEKYEPPKKRIKYKGAEGKFVTQEEYYKNQPTGIVDLKIEPTPKREKPKEIVFKNSGDKEPTIVRGMTLDEWFDLKKPDKETR